MHGLAWGPTGDLYFSAGDPFLLAGSNAAVPDHWGTWTWYHGPTGAAVRHVGTGGVFRCRPDGSDLRPVAAGLRGPFGLAFDPDWNLFVNDNDHELRPDRFTPIRLLHVVAMPISTGRGAGCRPCRPSGRTSSRAWIRASGRACRSGCALTSRRPAARSF